MASERFNVNASLSKNWEHLQNKFVGTGHPDISRHEWATNHHRDTAATLLGHPDSLHLLAAAEGVSVGRARFNLLESMLQPCGPPPAAAVAAAAAAAGAGTHPKAKGAAGGGRG